LFTSPYVRLFIFFLNDSSWIGIDDANIYFVYMRNLATGHGFVFNDHGERVEGVTSLLWTLIGVLFFKIFAYPNIGLLLLNGILIGIILFKMNRFLIVSSSPNNTIFSRRLILLLALLPVIPGFFEWTVLSLLETGIWCFLLIIFALTILELNSATKKVGYYAKIALLIVLMVLTRPESMLWAPFFILFNGYKEYLLNTKPKDILWYTGFLTIVFGVSLSGLMGWRISYFGYPLPNTYYAKVSTSFIHNLFLGGKYVAGFLLYNPLFLLILVFNFLYLIKLAVKKKTSLVREKEYFSFIFLFAVFLFTLAIPLCTGGDYFANYRFMQPTIPLIIISFFFTDYARKIRLSILNIFLIAAGVFFSSYHNYHMINKQESKLAHEFIVAKNERYNSSELNKLFSENPVYPTQGVMAAGGCGFVYRGKTMDMLGLNHVKMAHAEKENDEVVMKNHAGFSKKVFFDDKPDLFWIAGYFSKQDNPEDNLKVSEFNKIIFKQVQDEEAFKKEYANCVITRHGYDMYLNIFAKKAFLNRLDKNVFIVREILPADDER